MDLEQRKLNKNEWNSIEIPINDNEKNILNMIKNGYFNIDICVNNNTSLLSLLKVNYSKNIDEYIYVNYLQSVLLRVLKKCNKTEDIVKKIKSKKQLIKKADLIRFRNIDKIIEENKNTDVIFEFVILRLLNKMIKQINEKSTKWMINYYTIKTMLTANVSYINQLFSNNVMNVLDLFERKIKLKKITNKLDELIEKNNYLLKFSDNKLYDHQKRLFTLFNESNGPQLVLYIAPTGTGKTMSPVGLSSKYKVIFVCAARHVGLALAKNAISSDIKVAFAFGCNEMEDIRLHYLSVIDFKKNTKTGGIGKVNNMIGDKVEIMICDLKSYIHAMNYMVKFNDKENIITYWDEPTITLDYEEHDIHDIIQTNWSQNVIPNMVLSSATLPREDEISDTISDFKNKFPNAIVTSIISHDCKKTIPIINKEGYVEIPHFMYENYDELKTCSEYCENNMTISRYIDLYEISKFISYINKHSDYITDEKYLIENYFKNIMDINMLSIKTYYLKLIQNIKPEKWSKIYNKLKEKRHKKYYSTIKISTNDSHTLTDGPTIFLADDVEKIAKYCIQSANIPDYELDKISKNIEYNNVINERLKELNNKLEDKIGNDLDKDNKMTRENRNPEVLSLKKQISDFENSIKLINLERMYIPNKKEHLRRFSPENMNSTNIFTSNIDGHTVEKIMKINDVDDYWKLLLLMGIGVFTTHTSVRYTEIMKQLAQEQKLYLIIASTDYIYGTNYQFCHGYIGKDLNEISQEKTIQAMGRIGRNNIQQNYSMRFRDNNIIRNLFEKCEYKPEVFNMNRLFTS